MTRNQRDKLKDMGILRVTLGVESPLRRGDLRELPETMVDTGSEYTWVPHNVLADLGVGVERIERFVTADGRIIARELGYAIIHAAGVRTIDEVVFSEPGDMTLLGAHTIEGMNLRIDLKTKQLVPAGPVPVAATTPSRSAAAWPASSTANTVRNKGQESSFEIRHPEHRDVVSVAVLS